MPALRRITREEDLLELADALPALQCDVLLSLVDHPPERVYSDIIEPVAGSPKVIAQDLSAALERPVNRASYLVVTDAAELQDALAWPMDRWRIYLHPTQRALAYPMKPYSGPARVTGGPGTGKTVVAVHRAKALADAAAPGDRILLTTYGSTLARTLEDLLRRLGGDAMRRRVDVLTTDTLARRIFQEAGRRINVLNDDERQAMLRAHLAQVGSDLDPQVLLDEWDRVVLDQGLTSGEAYLGARRRRMRRLSAAQKERVWAALDSFADRLAGDGLVTSRQITVEAARLAERMEIKPYRHVIVDEAQDITAAQWRLLRAVVPQAPDDMFIVGDAYQRIYDSHAVLSHHGVHTRGRGRRLTISYRTTLEIVRGGVALMKGDHYDDLDDGTDTLDGYRSLMHGPAPTVIGHTSLAAELDAVADQVAAWRSAGVPPADIAAGARTHGLASRVVAALAERGLVATFVKDDAGAPPESVHVMTLHRLKGLEYRCVAIAGLAEGVVRPAIAWLPPATTPGPAGSSRTRNGRWSSSPAPAPARRCRCLGTTGLAL